MRIIQNFLQIESAGGLVLFFAAFLAMIVCNSPAGPLYQMLMNAPHMNFLINEGFMTLFFLIIGLELKREFLIGELSGINKVILPGVAALGGMVVPAIIFACLNYQYPETIKGWAIPVATDIAFALGVLSLFGRFIPLGLKLFLMALAIFDDLGAILIISTCYVQHISILFLCLSGILCSILILLNRRGVTYYVPYLFVGILLWICILYSGVHPTIAGVLLAFTIPLQGGLLHQLEKKLHPWVAYLILPVFAFVNAGVPLHDLSWHLLLSPLALGVILGLFIGKQVGVFSFAWFIIKCGWAKRPGQATWGEFYAVCILCGIGFTMSLFLGTLAFQGSHPDYLVQVRLSVLLGSLLSGLIGAGILYSAIRNKNRGAKFEIS